MTIHTTVYAAYGLPLPTDIDEITVDKAVGPYIVDHLGEQGVGYLNAAPYDHTRLFLVAACFDVEIGDDAKPVPLGDTDPIWNTALLQAAVTVVGTERLAALSAPGWFVVVDQS